MNENSTQLYQPVETYFEPTSQKDEAITIKEFLELLKQEEEFFMGEKHKTKLMVTRLRKIFNDKVIWDKDLIRKAAHINGRYEVKPIEDKEATYKKRSQGGLKLKHQQVKVKEADWMNPNIGTVPDIYANDNQKVILEDGLYSDFGHVLAGIDAFNNFAAVKPLPGFLFWLRFAFPNIKSNLDFATWLGNITSSSGEFFFEYLKKKKPLSNEDKQRIINCFAPGHEMLGNIDACVICQVYNTSASYGLRVSEIFRDYYCEGGMGEYYRKRRYSFFSSAIGLKGWNGEGFNNENEWLEYQKKQLYNSDVFYIHKQSKWPKNIWLTIVIWLKAYKNVLDMELLLYIFLKSLKEKIKVEPD